jgi:transposase
MLPATHILGIDIAKDKFDVNLRRAETVDDRLQATFSNNPQGFKALHKWLQQHGPRSCSHLHACMEATSCYGDALAAFLYDEDYQVSLVNPRRTRQYGDSLLTRNRNDKIEAGLIADFCASQRETLRLWEPLSPAHRQLRDLTRARQTLVDDRERFANMLETATGMARTVFQKQVRQLKRQIKDLERAIKQYVALQTELKQPVELADSIVGVGLVTAATVIAELPPMEKISQAAQAVALFGLDPIKKTSGSSVNTAARLSRMGSRRGRKALYMPALVALRCNPIVRELGLRLQQKGRSGKYIVVAAMRKLLRLIFGVVKRGRPFDPEYTFNSQTAPKTQLALATV